MKSEDNITFPTSFLRYVTGINITCGKFCEIKILHKCQHTFVVFIILSHDISVEQKARLFIIAWVLLQLQSFLTLLL